MDPIKKLMWGSRIGDFYYTFKPMFKSMGLLLLLWLITWIILG